MTQQCICGSIMGRTEFSENFDAMTCPSCKTIKFVGNSKLPDQTFDYMEKNDKYSEAEYLYGSVLRWSHRQLLEMSWDKQKCLEIGCFNGFFISKLEEKGAAGFGVEHNPEARRVGESIFGLRDKLMASIDQSLEIAPFDSVLCIDVLEHIEDPAQFIDTITSLLTPNGRVYIAGPTIERRFFDKSDFPPHHHWRFSRAGLSALLESKGFVINSIAKEYNGLLLARNFLGRLFNGYKKKEFYGNVVMSAPKMEHPVLKSLYKLIENASSLVFRILGISYCSTLISATKKHI